MCVQGFGCKVLAHDIRPSEEVQALGVAYVSKEELLQQADVISLHCPLLPSTYHIIDAARWAADDRDHFSWRDDKEVAGPPCVRQLQTL